MNKLSICDDKEHFLFVLTKRLASDHPHLGTLNNKDPRVEPVTKIRETIDVVNAVSDPV
jgi:hypothetical protein